MSIPNAPKVNGDGDPPRVNGPGLHPAWLALIEYCRRLQHGEIERLRIQDGLPVIAEVITKKVKFNS